MSFGSLNSAALNRVALNAVAGTVIVLASASFTAEATVTTAVPTHVHAGTFDQSCDLQVTFVQEFTQAARLSGTLDSTFSGVPFAQRSADGAWTINSVFAPVVYRTIYAEAGMDSSSAFEGLPNALLGTGDWTSTAVFESEAYKIGALAADWDLEVDPTFDGGDRTRTVDADLVMTSTLWAEADTTTGGVTTFDAHLIMAPSVTLDIPNHLVATFINGAFALGGVDWNADSNAIFAGAGDWQFPVVMDAEATKTQWAAWSNTGGSTLQVNEALTHIVVLQLTGTAVFEASGKIVQQVNASLASSNTLTLAPTQTSSLAGAWTTTVTTEFTGVRVANPIITVTVGASITNVGTHIHAGGVAWSILGSSVSAAVNISKIPAPLNRTYALSTATRNWSLSGGTRIFEVSP